MQLARAIRSFRGTLGDPKTPVGEAIKACQDAGGIANYDEPDDFTFVVSCQNGRLCQGGAEQETECHGGNAGTPQTAFPTQAPSLFVNVKSGAILRGHANVPPTTTKPYTGPLEPACGPDRVWDATKQACVPTAASGGATAPAPQEGLSTGTYVAIAAGGVAVLGAIYLLARR